MTRKEAKSCISTIEMLQRLAYNIHGVMDVIDADNCEKIIKALEQEPKSGQWVHRNDDFNDWLECSECGYGGEGEVKFGEGTNFCPHCGADMRDKT